MFKFLKHIFRRSDASAAPSPASKAPRSGAAPRTPEVSAGVEVASLSLRAILEKLPTDLKAGVNQMPDDDVKIVLPVNTIMKQLPTGMVRMSLASLFRQAPTGTFRKTDVEEKRMVEVPLAEVFKTINMSRLQRRSQREFVVPDEIEGLFGSNGRARTVSTPNSGSKPSPEPAPAESPKVLRMQPATPEPAPEPAKILRMPAPKPSQSAAPRSKAIAPTASSAPSTPSAPLKLDGELALSLVEVASCWNDGVRGELSVLTGDTRVVIPVGEVSAGLQKGRVAFPWSQLKKWLVPPAPASVSIPDDTVLLLPLKVVAPAFVAASGASKRTSAAAAVNEKLPDFFGPSAGRVPEASAPAPAIQPPAPAAPVETAPAPAPTTAAVSLVAEPVSSATRDSEPAPVAGGAPTTLAELFKKPDTSDWTPAALVKAACELPGVLGSVVALEEGLVVAQKLPDGLSADTFAAFMPQIFSRIDKYTSEMQLGDTTEIMVSTAGGPCQIVRRGKVFVAFLGRGDTKLPPGLHLIAHEISTQNA